MVVEKNTQANNHPTACMTGRSKKLIHLPEIAAVDIQQQTDLEFL